MQAIQLKARKNEQMTEVGKLKAEIDALRTQLEAAGGGGVSAEQQAKMQKMMMWMPVMFGFMLYSYPAGLSLYMITSSAVGIFEIKVIKKFWPIDDTEMAPKKGWMMRLAEKQAEQQASMQKMQKQQQQSKQKARKKRKR